MLLFEIFEDTPLDKPTPTVDDLAKKYNVSVRAVKQQLLKGIQVELEHTSDPKVAEEIALDHLREKLDYYTLLAQIEEAGVGIITKQNTTPDVKPGETQRQAKKLGMTLDKKNRPPLLHKKAVKNSSPNTLFNLGLNEHIRKEGNKYTVYSKNSKRKFGTYTSRAEAEKRLRQIEMFKHMG